MLLFLNYDEYSEYFFLHNLVAIAILVIVFFLLGWFISRLLRPSGSVMQQELHDIKKDLLEELNAAKKFNAEYQLLVKQETEKMNKLPNEKES